MKRLLSLSILATIFCGLAASCGSDEEKEEDFAISSSEETIKVGNTSKLTATSRCSWSSDNEFVAEIDDDGNVKTNHVGETVIKAVSAKDARNSVECKVIVEGLYNTYKEPVLEFGISRSELLEKESRDFSHQYGSEGMAFSGENSIVDRVNYYFDDDKLVQADVVIYHNGSDAVKETVNAYLNERYATNDILNAIYSANAEKGYYYLTDGYNNDYDIVVYHYPYAVSFGSTASKWGNYRWSIIYTYKGRKPTTNTENW